MYFVLVSVKDLLPYVFINVTSRYYTYYGVLNNFSLFHEALTCKSDIICSQIIN